MKKQWVWSAIASVPLLIFSWAVQAAEGFTKDLQQPIAPESQRESRYSLSKGDESQLDKGTLHTEMKHAATVGEIRGQQSAATLSAPSDRKSAQSATAQSLRSSGFYFYSAASALLVDRDRDGYYSELRIRFDADTDYLNARVYAKLYMRRIGESQWKLYRATDDFTINGHTGTDEYTVITTLDSGFPTAEYDVLVDLYDAVYNELVATISPTDSAALGYLPLEEAGLDLSIDDIGVSIGRVTTTLLIDSDSDGYYSRLRVSFDPAAYYPNQYVYAKVWVRPQGGEWILEHTSSDLLVDQGGSADSYSFTADWLRGYPTALYDVQIDLHDALTGNLVASAGSERPELSRVPLEDASRDTYVSPPVVGSSTQVTISSEQGGGAMSMWWLLGLLGLVAAQRAHDMRALRRAG